MNTNNIAIALLSDNLKTVLVRFKHSDGNLSPKQYSYMSTIDLAPGDEAIVDSPFGGYKVVVVEEVTKKLVDLSADFDYKLIVQRVDVEANATRLKVIKELQDELIEHERQRALAEFKSYLGLKEGDKLSSLVELLRKNLA